MRKEFEEKFAELAKSLERLREEAKATAVRWDFSTADILSQDLVPNSGAVFFAAAYDSVDRPIYIKHFDMDPGPLVDVLGEPIPNDLPLRCEEFIGYIDDVISISRFFGSELDSVHRVRVQNGRVLESEQLRSDGTYHDVRWEYENGRDKRYQSLSDDGRVEYEIEYGQNGEQTRYRVRRDGTRFELGRPLPKNVTVKSLKQTIRERLLSVVPDLVGKAGITEPIYCVALAYDNEGNDALPPSFAIGVQSERSRWLEQHGKRARDFIWNPAEFYHFEKAHLFWEDEALEEACDLLNSHLAEKDSVAPAIKLLVEVAVELNGITWRTRCAALMTSWSTPSTSNWANFGKTSKRFFPPKDWRH